MEGLTIGSSKSKGVVNEFLLLFLSNKLESIKGCVEFVGCLTSGLFKLKVGVETNRLFLLCVSNKVEPVGGCGGSGGLVPPSIKSSNVGKLGGAPI